MYAAVVHSFDHPPRYEVVATPKATTDTEVIVEVLAVGLHPRVRSGASGTHYTSTGALPLVPGIDGVGRLRDGRCVYFVASDTALGTMAEYAVVDLRRSVPLPVGVDVAMIAAAMNPAMSSWVALHTRIAFVAGQRVLVHGATGSAGQMAVQIAKRLGASQVIGAGRNPERLAALRDLGADTVVSLAGDTELAAAMLGEAAADVDVVIDYLWGTATVHAIPALLTHRSDPSQALSWIQIGSVAGPTISLPSDALRSANIRLLGSGQGAVSTAGFVAALPALVKEIAAGAFRIDLLRTPLSEVERAWNAPVAPGQRIVFLPRRDT